MLRRRVHTPVEQGCIVGLQEAGWTYQQIAAHVGTMYHWCAAAFCDQVLDGHKVQMHIKIDALCKQQWPPKQHPGKNSGYMLHLLTVRLRLCLPLARLPLRPWHHQVRLLVKVNWRMEWHFAVFSDENMFSLYASNGRTSVWHRLGECHFLDCIHPRHRGPTSGFMVWEAISYNSRSHLVFLHGKVNSARYMA